MIDVRFACGHTGRKTVHGDQSAQAKYIAELEQSDCSSCWLKKQPAQFSVQSSPKGSVICGKYCYPIREALQARGYYFLRPSWRKLVASLEEQSAELRWITEQGYAVVDVQGPTREEKSERRREAKTKQEALLCKRQRRIAASGMEGAR
jgi:hypothetical protein